METISTIERLRDVLKVEEASETLTALPPDIYIKLANYAQKLRATTGAGNEDAPGRLAKKQLWLLEVMTRQLLGLRLAKAEKEEEERVITSSAAPAAAATNAGGADLQPLRSSSKNLLPEERHINDVLVQLTHKEERFVKAVVDGQPSFFTLVQRREMQRMMTVRISKRMGEIIGADLKKYGPFEVNDVARLPMGNAQVMIASRQAEPVSSTGDYS